MDAFRVASKDTGAGAVWRRLTETRMIVRSLCLLLVLAAGIVPTGFFETSANWVFDAYQRLAPRVPSTSTIVVIDIDAESIRRIGQWPWRRDRIARLIDAAAGARVVGLDVLLTEPDRLSPSAWLADWPNLAPDIKDALSALPQSDTLLAASMARVPVVLAAAAGAAASEQPAAPIAITPIFETGDDPRSGLSRYPSIAWPLPELAKAARGVGVVSVLSEADGITRRIPVVTAVDASLIPNFALEVLRVAAQSDRIDLRSDATGGRHLDIAGLRVDIDGWGRVWPRFSAPLRSRFVPAYRVLDGDIPPAFFRDMIVLIGASAPGLGDVILTPLHHAEPGVIAQAQLIESIASGDVLWRPPTTRIAELLFALALGASAMLLFGRVPDRVYATIFGGIAALFVLASFAAFRTVGLLIDWTFPLAALAATVLVALVVRVRDEVHSRRRREHELAAALLKAETADRAKTEFLANVSHELRTPLTAVMGFSEIMFNEMLGPLSPKYAEYARDIYRTATHLHAIITDILDLAVIDLGGKAPEDQPLDVASVIEECTRMLVARGAGNKVRIRTAIVAPLPVLRADARMVRQMMINLLSNAVKYSPSGGEVVVTAEICRDKGLSISVRDSGPGIAAADIPYAVQRFGRLRSSKLAQEPGIGIGLPLTKTMIELHGGTMVVNSELGVGTEVRLWFPPSRLLTAKEPSPCDEPR